MLPKSTIPIAWRNLTENKRKLLASVAGTAFAVTLMFMENGFRHAMLDSMVELIERLDCQMVVVSRSLYTLAVPFNFPLRRLTQTRDFPEVVHADPVYLVTRMGYLRNPENGTLNRIYVIGVPPDHKVLDIEELEANRELWSRPNTAMADSLSRPAYFGTFQAGQHTELSGRSIEIVGTFELGINSQSNGNLIMSDWNLLRYFPDLSAPAEGDQAVTIGALQIQPGADLMALKDRIQRALPPDVRVLTRDEFIAKERNFWDHVAPIGTVFYIGVVMGFIVGCVICYQVLFSDISDRLAEFATLKAMGYSNFRLFRIVMTQGFYLAILGYAVGLVVSMVMLRWIHLVTGLPLDLSNNNPVIILVLSIVMCVLSGAYAARKLLSVDPAQLFA